MSPVQEAVLSLLPGVAQDPGTDLLVKAKTGTGKTLAFLIPAIQTRLNDLEAHIKRLEAEGMENRALRVQKNLEYAKRNAGAVIISPTRELATQIANEAVKAMHNLDRFDVSLFVGGANKIKQLREFRRGRPDIIVATPGRLVDLLQSVPEVANVLGGTKTLILDEADTLLDMGFKDDLDTIVSYLPPKHQRRTFLFSATVSKDIQRIANSAMRPKHAFIDCVPENESNVHEHIPQYHTVVPSASLQIPHIIKLLAQDQLLHPEGGKAIIFLPTTRFTILFSNLLASLRRHLPWGARTEVFEIHSKKDQKQRDAASQGFRHTKGGYQVLVTSDVSARGVDYPGVTRVIQVGIPSTRDIYVHRVGRTGRAGKAGRGDIVLLPWEVGYINQHLHDLPLKDAPIDEFNRELAGLTAHYDANNEVLPQSEPAPTARHLHNNKFSRPPGRIQPPVTDRLAGLENDLTRNVLPGLDESAVGETFASLLGYYAAKAPDLRITKAVVLKGLQEWAMEAGGMSREPYVSDQFLQKMGFNSTKNRGKPRVTNYRDSGEAPWMGRGKTAGRGGYGASRGGGSFGGYSGDGGRAPRYDDIPGRGRSVDGKRVFNRVQQQAGPGGRRNYDPYEGR
jgi:ATP-dependent RNA helicase MSS116